MQNLPNRLASWSSCVHIGSVRACAIRRWLFSSLQSKVTSAKADPGSADSSGEDDSDSTGDQPLACKTIGPAGTTRVRYSLRVILAVLIPVYNEASLVAAAIARVEAARLVDSGGKEIRKCIFLVDDGSSDGTSAVLAAWNGRTDISLVTHERNRGKGAAVRTALKAALAWTGPAGGRADLFVIHDADLEYDPADHAGLLEPLLHGKADAVIGSRFLGSSHRVLYYWHSVANRFLTFCSNVCTNLNLSDIECCLKAFTRPVAERLTIEEDRFGLEPELIAKLASLRVPHEERPTEARALRIYETAVSYAGRTYAEGKKITWQDGLAALRCIVRYNLLR